LGFSQDNKLPDGFVLVAVAQSLPEHIPYGQVVRVKRRLSAHINSLRAIRKLYAGLAADFVQDYLYGLVADMQRNCLF
jgi:hypothetical protein